MLLVDRHARYERIVSEVIAELAQGLFCWAELQLALVERPHRHAVQTMDWWMMPSLSTAQPTGTRRPGWRSVMPATLRTPGLARRSVNRLVAIPVFHYLPRYENISFRNWKDCSSRFHNGKGPSRSCQRHLWKCLFRSEAAAAAYAVEGSKAVTRLVALPTAVGIEVFALQPAIGDVWVFTYVPSKRFSSKGRVFLRMAGRRRPLTRKNARSSSSAMDVTPSG